MDQPGSGEALRLQNLPVDLHSEHWASKAVDWLEQQDEVDARRIGMTGISPGGHFAPRAVTYEPRFASGAVWGANHNWREVQDKRMAREGENPVPHYWAHVHWAFGATDQQDFLAKSDAMNLNGHMDGITVPFLVTHGANDRQINVAYADDLYDQLVNSPRREKVIFTAREGGWSMSAQTIWPMVATCFLTGSPKRWVATPPDATVRDHSNVIVTRETPIRIAIMGEEPCRDMCQSP